MTKMKKVLACELCGYNCLGCFYSDICGDYEDIPLMGRPMVFAEFKSVSMALCEGRHEIPEAVDGSIFSNTIDPLDMCGLEVIASRKLHRVYKLDLYVTGLTVALVSVLNVCHKNGVKVTLWHYDLESGTYYPQEVK